MVLIISKNDDQYTNLAIEYFIYYNIPFIRINEDTIVTINRFDINDFDVNFELVLNDEFYDNYIISYKQIKGVWYRRGNIAINYPKFQDDAYSIDNNLRIQIYLDSEIKDVEDTINYLLKYRKPNINSFIDNSLVKLKALILAKKNGLTIPKTLISSYRDQIKNEIKNNSYITKDIKNIVVFLDSEKNSISGETNLINLTDLEKINEITFPNFIQRNILKEFEIRSFFLHNEFFSTAIFSQNDEQTKIDFRNYNFEKLNRVVPYKLPREIEIKLLSLMKDLELNSGSIDLIKSKKGDFVFLEVNPVGLYGQVSVPGQYFLDKKIAEYFKNIQYE